MDRRSPAAPGNARAAGQATAGAAAVARDRPTAPPLRHLVIIPDGNRRWAAARGLPAWDGVRHGAATAEHIFEAVLQRHVPWCTFWASSYDNLLKRSLPERVVLNELFASWFGRLAHNETIHRERVRVRFVGEWRSLLTPAAQESMESVLTKTAAHDGPALTFLVGYDGDRELAAAVTTFMNAQSARRTGPGANASLDVRDLRERAWTQELPDVDLLVRTGSWEDPHRSANLLPFLTSNVQEAYPPVFWPDFSEEELGRVLDDYAAREQRHGS